jgi:hypothetical protein
MILLMIMLGAVYTHYILRDKFERMAPGLVFSLLLITRLIIHRQVTQREKSQRLSQAKNKNETPESGDGELTNEPNDKRVTKKNEKKNK